MCKNKQNTDSWINFAKGHWQKTMPKKAGVYPVAHITGGRLIDKRVDINPEGKSYELNTFYLNKTRTDFHGWWWSEPYPELPQPPYPELHQTPIDKTQTKEEKCLKLLMSAP